MNRRHCLAALAAALAVTGLASATRPLQAAAGLPHAPALAGVYDLILDARFDEVPAGLRRACGPAPAAACSVLDAMSTFWEILLDPQSPSRDAVFLKKAEDAIAAAERLTSAEPQRAEAWFYLGGAYGARVQLRGLRGQFLAAARDGKRIHDALQRAIALDPNLQDAYFGLGLYHYYAAIAPATARVLGRLLLLPGGNRAEGLREMARAQNRGELMRGEADYQLHLIHLWYERQTPSALRLAEDLRTRYPHNPLFALRVAEIQSLYLHDVSATFETYRGLLDAARAGRVGAAAIAEVQARLGLAQQLDGLHETDRAIDHLQWVIGRAPTVPYASVARAQYQLGAAYDRMGFREQAARAYQAAIASAPADDLFRLRGRAREGLRRAPTGSAGDGYRRGLEAWRLAERGSFPQAETAFREALALRPVDHVIRYRYARLLLMRGDAPAARRELESVLGAPQATPPVFLAAAFVELAQLIEPTDRPRALDLYRSATQLFGADARTRDAAAHAIRRLQPPSPTP